MSVKGLFENVYDFETPSDLDDLLGELEKELTEHNLPWPK